MLQAIHSEAENLGDASLYDIAPSLKNPAQHLATLITEVSASIRTPEIRKAEFRTAMELLAEELGIIDAVLQCVSELTRSQWHR